MPPPKCTPDLYTTDNMYAVTGLVCTHTLDVCMYVGIQVCMYGTHSPRSRVIRTIFKVDQYKLAPSMSSVCCSTKHTIA